MGRMGVEAHEHLGSNRKCAGGHVRQSHNGMAWGMGHGPHGQVRGGCVSFSCAVTLAADSPELWHSPLGQTTCVWRDARCMGAWGACRMSEYGQVQSVCESKPCVPSSPMNNILAATRLIFNTLSDSFVRDFGHMGVVG